MTQKISDNIKLNNPEPYSQNQLFEKLMMLIINEHLYNNGVIDNESREKLERKISESHS